MGIETIAIVGLAVAAAGAAVGVQQQAAAAKDQRKAAKEQRKAAAQQAARERRQSIREGRLARGQALNVAGQVGAGESSGLAGGLSGISTQVASNIGFSQQQEAFGANIVKFQQRANKASSRAATAQGISSIGSSVFSAAGGF